MNEWMLQNPRTKQTELPLSGSALRDAGMQQAENHAEAVAPGWKIRAMEYLQIFLQQQGSVPFLTEYFRTWAYSRGLDRPPHERAFGAVISRARKNKMIEFVRHESVSNHKAHRAIASVWKAA